MEEEKDIREEFRSAIENGPWRNKWVAKEACIHPVTLSKILNQKYPLTERNRNRLNEILGTDFGDKTEI